jgi:hypothetical protein
MKTDELRLAEGELQKLKDESDRLNGLMDQMVSEMENIPPEKRDGNEWEAFTRRFLELQASQREVGEKLQRVRSALVDYSGTLTTKQ